MVYSTPIHQAIGLVQSSPLIQYIVDLNKRSSRNELMFIGAATFLTVYNLVAYLKEKRQKLRAPPTVAFGLPFVGHLPYILFMPKKFIDLCNKKYGEVYNINNFGSIITVASGDSGLEVLKADSSDLSLEEGALRDNLYLHYMMDFETVLWTKRVASVIGKSVISLPKVPQYIPSIQLGLEAGIKAKFNEDGPTILDKPSLFFQHLIAYMSVPSLLGEEFQSNAPVIKSFGEFTSNITQHILMWKFTPNVIHPLLIPHIRSLERNQQVIFEHVIPIVRLRREKIIQAKIDGLDHGLQDNFLTAFIQHIPSIDDHGQPVYYTDEQVADFVLSLSFASVHTSSTNLSYCLYWILARPDIREKLLEEIEQVIPGSTDITGEALAKMKFMNNFIRESLRQSAHVMGSGKKAMKDYTFANGYQIPQGRTIQTTNRQLNFGSNTNRSTVDAMDPMMSLDKPSTTPSKDYIAFGVGKHICPGRFFAVQKIEICLIYFLKNFDIQTLKGNKPAPFRTTAGGLTRNCEEPLVFTPKMV